jgi:hypothetical protein
MGQQVARGQHAARKHAIAAELEQVIAQAEGWQDDLAAILPRLQFAQYEAMVARMKVLLRRMQPGRP